MVRRTGLLLLAMLLGAFAEAATLTVRKDGTGDYAVIQAALDVAAAGDTILIGPGEYLEHTAVRFPAWLHDIESYANVTVDDLTIIGAGSDQTFIGPAVYSGNYSTASPKVVTYIEGGDIRLSGICLRNAHTGAFVQGRLFMDDCSLSDNLNNVGWWAVGSGGWIRDSQFDVVTPNSPISIDIVNDGGAGGIAIEDCSVQHSPVLIDGVNGVMFSGCLLSNTMSVLNVYGGARVQIGASTVSSASRNAVNLTSGIGSVCVIEDSEVMGGQAALAVLWAGCGFEVRRSRVTGGSYAVVYTEPSVGTCVLTECDLVKGDGPVFRCAAGGLPVVHDFRNNFWGTTDEATIQSWIIDHSDDPNIGATVLYSPFAGQSVPTESTSWGDLKASFR